MFEIIDFLLKIIDAVKNNPNDYDLGRRVREICNESKELIDDEITGSESKEV